MKTTARECADTVIDLEPVAMRRQRFAMPSGVREIAHAHDAWHLIRVEAGGFEEDDGRNGVHVGEGSWRLSPPGLSHELIAGDAGAACVNLHIRDRDLARRLFASMDQRHHFLDDLPEPSEGGGLAANHMTVAAAIRRVCGDDAEPPDWLVELHACLSGPHSRIADASIRLGVSREHASREYRRFFGLAPAKARQFAAAEQAMSLLSDMARPLCDVALEAGFYDQAHMTRTLGAVYGATPSTLRKALGTSH